MRKWTDKFDVDVNPGPLPDGVARARRDFAQANANNGAILEPRIDAHLMAYEAALLELAAFHEQIGDHGDLDLAGDSRQAAAWLVSGRIIGLLNAAVKLARTGFASEMVPILRTAHEATHLLRCLSMHRDTTILELWLKDHHVKPSRVRQAEDRNQKKIASEMRKFGEDPPGRTKDFMDSLYEGLSEIAHVKRSRVFEIASVDCRQMPVNGHPAATVRAFFVYLLGYQVTEAVPAVGFGLGISRGDDVVARTQATLAQLLELSKKIPIDPETLRGEQAAA